MPHESIAVVGVGAVEGTGCATAARFAAAGYKAWIIGRTEAKLSVAAQHIRDQGCDADYVVADVTSEQEIDAAFARIESDDRRLASVVYNAGNNRRQQFLDVEPEFFRQMWNTATYGAFLTAKRAIPTLLEGADATNKRSLLFTGASASLRGREGFAAFATAKGGLRMLVQSLAREFGRQRLHVGHLVVDGGIYGSIIKDNLPGVVEYFGGEEGMLNVGDLAEAFFYLHNQNRSAWTLELDVRPFKEKF